MQQREPDVVSNRLADGVDALLLGTWSSSHGHAWEVGHGRPWPAASPRPTLTRSPCGRRSTRHSRSASRRRRHRGGRQHPRHFRHPRLGLGRTARRHPRRATPGRHQWHHCHRQAARRTRNRDREPGLCRGPRRRTRTPRSRPSRGRRGRGFRRAVSGIPTGKFRDRLAQMAHNAGLTVVVIDPAYTSRWAAEHWLAPLREHHPKTTGHHAAALVIGRRGLGHRARRRATGNPTAPAEAARPAQARPRTTPATRPAPRKPATPRGPRQPPGTKTGRPHRITAGNQAAQDRSGPPAEQHSVTRNG